MSNKILFPLLFIVGCTSGYPEDNSILECTRHVEVQLQDNIIYNCPKDMQWVHGLYCTKVEQNCKSYLDPEGSKFTRRCKEFEPTKCVGNKVPMSFCMDTNEYSSDGILPKSDMSWTEAKAICQSSGKRLCSEPEWTFACEGEDSYPYSTGLVRPSDKCNMDIEKNTVCGSELCDHRNTIDDNANCLSPFNINNMSGNVD